MNERSITARGGWRRPLRHAARALLGCGTALVAIAAFAGAPARIGNFSQHPGWAAWYAAHPPRSTPATEAERALLGRLRPRIFLPAGHAGLIDFYRDYIASGRLERGDGTLIAATVDRDLLNAHKADPLARFTHVPDRSRPPTATVYARLDRAPVDLGGAGVRQFAFLTYHAVFRHSGLPAGFDGLAALALGVLGDLDDWHQLDHYTAATVVLDEEERPIALMLQQHSYLHTFVLGESLPRPPDGRVAIDVAIRSNELYPHTAGRRRHRATDFATPANVAYLMGFGAAPRNAADDITDPAVEAAYALEFLPPDDAFYVFQGYLGAHRRLPGREAPPGADYNVWPELKALGRQLLFGYWREGEAADHARLQAGWAHSGDRLDFVRAQAAAFAAALDAAR